MREIDKRLRFLRKRMEIAEVVDPARQKNKRRVYFGATVTYRTQHGEDKTVRIVGIDEARSELHEISGSHRSPRRCSRPKRVMPSR